MGNIVFGIPKRLALELKEFYDLRFFVETGTYRGQTIRWAADEFEKCWTIENWLERYNMNVVSEPKKPNITYVYGDSRVALPEVLKEVKGRALIWLDAHNTKDVIGQKLDYPILSEIEACRGTGHVICIDDAHIFKESDGSQAPTLKDIMEALYGYDISIDTDVIVAIPENI